MKKKSLITIISVTLILVVAIAGTLAWLTDRDAVTNVFTVGDIEIELDETLVNKYGEPVDGNGELIQEGETVVKTDDTNNYHLVPGETYVKDPTITVFADNEPSYVRMLVKVNCVKELDAIFDTYKDEISIPEIFLGYDAENWAFFDDYLVTEKVDGKDVFKRVYEFRYKYTVTGTDQTGSVTTDIVPALDKDTRLAPLFTELKVPGVLTKEDLQTLENLVIEVEGHAIQAATFEADAATDKTAADVAWAAFDAQYTKNKTTE